MSDFKEFENPWSAENSEWFGEEKDKWFEGGKYNEWFKESSEYNDKINQKYRDAIKKGLIVYTCNCGWIDRTHAFMESNRPNISADKLWKQIKNETGTKSNSPNESGFLVIYRQDATVTSFLPPIGVTRKYFVEYGLDVEVKEKIALSILQEVSIAFEELQSYGSLIGRGDSSFEPADLVSNLLGFYSVIRPSLSESKIFELAKRFSTKDSLNLFDQYPDTFTNIKYKNKKFTPIFFPNKKCSNPIFPLEFQEIEPQKKGDNYRDWSELWDIYAGKPPKKGLTW
ncbi:hypothetical protein [Flavobacterium sp.]|uniref:hypothetical protein n=1 Tax=Flavobacterium sp. TaxID=239 RepID=UPI00262E1C9D|nr:hypothetical protein [Flavobacterium sp.]MDD3005440.1 hypothetical protein [Flavobacterium sp.]